MNFDLIKSNLAEAAEELAALQNKAANGSLNEGDFQVRLLHAYHHLNWAWNTRHLTAVEYDGFILDNFKKWGKYPPEIEDL